MIDYENDDNLSDEELLSIPAERVPALSRLWAIRSVALHFKQMTELAAELAGNARPTMLFPDRDPRNRHHEEEERRRALLAYEAAIAEMRDHADRLLLRIDEEQSELERRRKELEGRALHLHDGSRFWIDGNRYRGDDGIAFEGRDHVEAADLARLHPGAPTWTEHENIRVKAEETERIKEKVLAARDGAGDAAEAEKHLSTYERELNDMGEKRQAALPTAPPVYGDGDYSDLLTAEPAFNKAAATDNVPTTQADNDTETTSLDLNRPFRTMTPKGPKLS